MTQTVYQPDGHKHSESLPRFASHSDIDKIVKCSCGKYFYMYDISYVNGSWRFYACWTYVRWYHWRKQKLIREWEKNEQRRN